MQETDDIYLSEHQQEKEFEFRGVDPWTIVSRAKDLLQLFGSGATAYEKFLNWYNSVEGRPRPEPKAVNHPRTDIHRQIDDFWAIGQENGIVGVIENQTLDTLKLVHIKQWYGWIGKLKVAPTISGIEANYFDRVYSGPFANTAAIGFKYEIVGTRWCAYFGVYTSRFGSNATVALLSTRTDIPWEEIYSGMTTSLCFSRPEGCPYMIVSEIDQEYRATAYCQLAPAEHERSISRLTFIFRRWVTPRDYKDGL